MAKKNDDLKNKLASKASGDVQKKQDPANTIAAYIKKMESQFKMALPKHLDTDRFMRIALTEIRKNPKLLECSIQSLLGGLMQAAQLGLEPGLIGQCYLIPFRNKKTGGVDVQFIMGYKGMIDLARRSGNIESFYSQVVKENDEFQYEYGLEPKLIHKPAWSDRGKTIGAYAVTKFKDGGYQFEFMGIEDIEKRRERSKAGNSGPWVTDYDEMCMKTVVRHMFKYLPISIEIMRQAIQDETVKNEIKEDMTEVEGVDFDVVDAEYEIQDDQPKKEEKPEQHDRKGEQTDLSGTPYEQ